MVFEPVLVVIIPTAFVPAVVNVLILFCEIVWVADAVTTIPPTEDDDDVPVPPAAVRFRTILDRN